MVQGCCIILLSLVQLGLSMLGGVESSVFYLSVALLMAKFVNTGIKAFEL